MKYGKILNVAGLEIGQAKCAWNYFYKDKQNQENSLLKLYTGASKSSPF